MISDDGSSGKLDVGMGSVGASVSFDVSVDSDVGAVDDMVTGRYAKGLRGNECTQRINGDRNTSV